MDPRTRAALRCGVLELDRASARVRAWRCCCARGRVPARRRPIRSWRLSRRQVVARLFAGVNWLVDDNALDRVSITARGRSAVSISTVCPPSLACIKALDVFNADSGQIETRSLFPSDRIPLLRPSRRWLCASSVHPPSLSMLVFTQVTCGNKSVRSPRECLCRPRRLGRSWGKIQGVALGWIIRPVQGRSHKPPTTIAGCNLISDSAVARTQEYSMRTWPQSRCEARAGQV